MAHYGAAPDSSERMPHAPSFPSELPPRPKRLSTLSRLVSHNHTEIDPDYLEGTSSPNNLFLARRHKACDLTILVDAFAHRTPTAMTTWQNIAYDRFKGSENIHSQLDLDDEDLQDLSLIQAYFQIFDDFFFFGTLKAGTCLDLVDELDLGHVARCVEIQDTIDRTTDLYIPKPEVLISCRIEIKITGSICAKHRRIKYLSLLLHEMCHAFFTLYACRSRRCHKKAVHEGEDGHGDAWCDMAQAVEEGAMETFDLKLDLERQHSCAYELLTSGASVSKKWRSWGFKGLAAEMKSISWDEKGCAVDSSKVGTRWTGVVRSALFVVGIVLVAALA